VIRMTFSAMGRAIRCTSFIEFVFPSLTCEPELNGPWPPENEWSVERLRQ
jgi:hypothetical protein